MEPIENFWGRMMKAERNMKNGLLLRQFSTVRIVQFPWWRRQHWDRGDLKRVQALHLEGESRGFCGKYTCQFV
jgi:hypothetical protein